MKSSRNNIWNSTWMHVLVAVLIAISAVLFFTFAKPIEYFTSSDPKLSLEYFYSENCPHCKDFSPIWDDAVNKIKADATVSKKLEMKKFETNDDKQGGKSRSEKYNIHAVPTVLYIYGPGPNEFSEYDGPRTADGLHAFVKAKVLTAPS